MIVDVSLLFQKDTSTFYIQKDTTKIAGVGLRSYQYYESGERNPTSDVLINLGNYYDASIDFLVGRTDNREINR